MILVLASDVCWLLSAAAVERSKGTFSESGLAVILFSYSFQQLFSSVLAATAFSSEFVFLTRLILITGINIFIPFY